MSIQWCGGGGMPCAAGEGVACCNRGQTTCVPLDADCHERLSLRGCEGLMSTCERGQGSKKKWC